ncbi:MAG: DUF2188 domain-containing protein [Bacillales bacterium]|nr:DUF2188 domain-containing protein [Bacillales bacterium]
MKKNKVTCRHCKEEKNWEIALPNGEVFTKHYPTKKECVKKARELAEEYACDLVIENKYTR